MVYSQMTWSQVAQEMEELVESAVVSMRYLTVLTTCIRPRRLEIAKKILMRLTGNLDREWLASLAWSLRGGWGAWWRCRR